MKKLNDEQQVKISQHLGKAATCIRSAQPLITKDLGQDFCGNDKKSLAVKIIVESAASELDAIQEILKRLND